MKHVKNGSKTLSANCKNWMFAGLMVFNTSAFAGGYVVDSANSNVNFSVTKVQYVIEPAEFQKVSGTVSDEGEVAIEIDLNSVYSNNAIRDNRLVNMFFQTEMFPSAAISAEIDPKVLKSAEPQRIKVPAVLEWFDHEEDITLDVLVAPVAGGGLVVTSMSPNIIDAKTFGLPSDHLEALRKVCNNITIADKAAVNFVLTLKKF